MRLPGPHTGPHVLQDFLDNEGFEETAHPGVTEQGFAGVDVQNWKCRTGLSRRVVRAVSHESRSFSSGAAASPGWFSRTASRRAEKCVRIAKKVQWMNAHEIMRLLNRHEWKLESDMTVPPSITTSLDASAARI